MPSDENPETGKKHRDNYRMNDNKLVCLHHSCKSEMPIKSNKGIYEEFARMSQYLKSTKTIEPSCPNKDCSNHGIPLSSGRKHYYKDGKQKSGSFRFTCRACNKVFTVSWNPQKGQNKSEYNEIIFRLLVNKVPMNRICEIVQISMPTLYSKIDFIHKQCQMFTGYYEQDLRKLPIKRLQISVDRQEYIVNWSDTTDKRNVIVHALGSADNRTGFVFGMHLNIDTEADKKEIESAAKACGDYDTKPAFREYARFWLDPDFEEAKRQKKLGGKGKKKLMESIAESYKEAELREDIESFEDMNSTTKLPHKGMQIHGEYTMYGHFQFLKELLPSAEKIRFYIEKESGIRAACLAAFRDDILSKRCDAFYVKINKEMTISQKNQAMAKGRWALDEFRDSNALYGDISDASLRALMLEKAIAEGNFFRSEPFHDKWYIYPAPTKNEPEKAVSWLTDTGGRAYDNFHLAKLMTRASLHGIDRFFMQVRRRVSLLERPIKTSSSMGRTWYGYSPYNPAYAAKVLEILRTYHNYVHLTTGEKRRKLKPGEKKRNPYTVQKTHTTPAMRLGLMSMPVDVEEILAFTTDWPPDFLLQ